MRAYELMVILDGQLEDNTAHGWIKQVSDHVAARGGIVIGQPDWWGKRRFAYEINHKWDGYFVIFNVVAEGGALDEFERFLRLADDVVRHKLIRLPDHEAARRGMVTAGSAG